MSTGLLFSFSFLALVWMLILLLFILSTFIILLIFLFIFIFGLAFIFVLLLVIKKLLGITVLGMILFVDTIGLVKGFNGTGFCMGIWKKGIFGGSKLFTFSISPIKLDLRSLPKVFWITFGIEKGFKSILFEILCILGIWFMNKSFGGLGAIPLKFEFK